MYSQYQLITLMCPECSWIYYLFELASDFLFQCSIEYNPEERKSHDLLLLVIKF
jgi:hypothetical protein